VESFKQETSSGQCLWVGHTSAALDVLRFHMWRVIVKGLMDKAGHVIRSFNDNCVTAFVTPGDLFVVQYAVGDGATLQVDFTVLVGSLWSNVVTAFAESATLRAEGVILKNIIYTPTVNAGSTTQDSAPVRLDLEYSYIRMYCKSTMKLQNRTINSSGNNEADDVDNSPLYGRTYGGNGNGAIVSGRYGSSVQAQLLANRSTGYILGSANDNAEPWHQMYFQFVTQQGKIHLDPGQIKTSVLVHRKNIHVNVLWKMCTDAVQSASAKSRSSLGKFRFFGIERMIDTGTAEQIVVGLEINSYVNMSLYSRIPRMTEPIFVRSALP